MRLQIGGSPCTHWSIAQTKNRETEPKGLGWDLFENYLIALEKFQPDYFLYENNKSMSSAIRAEITKRFGFDPNMEDPIFQLAFFMAAAAFCLSLWEIFNDWRKKK